MSNINNKDNILLLAIAISTLASAEHDDDAHAGNGGNYTVLYIGTGGFLVFLSAAIYLSVVKPCIEQYYRNCWIANSGRTPSDDSQTPTEASQTPTDDSDMNQPLLTTKSIACEM